MFTKIKVLSAASTKNNIYNLEGYSKIR